MFKSKLLFIAFTCCLIIVAGCGNGEPVTEEENGISIEVVNETENIVIAYAAFFGEDLAEWGEDLLDEDVIAPGEAITFVLPEGEYDLSLFNQDFFVISTFFDLTEDTTVIAGGEGKAPILIQNTSELDILFAFAFPGGFIDIEVEETVDEALEDNDEEDVVSEEWAELWEEIWEDDQYLTYRLLDDREIIIAENGRRYFFLEYGSYDFLLIDDDLVPYLRTDVELDGESLKVITLE